MPRAPETRPQLDPSLSVSEFRAGLDAIAKLRVAVIGETIIDEYAYCDAIGKSGKEPMLVTRFSGCETQAGGVLAIANHLVDFCETVEVVSALGDRERREQFVRSSLRDAIVPHFVTKPDSPTIVKRRYIDAYSHAKMLGVYQLNPAPLSDPRELHEVLDEVLPRVDVAIVADYGHGLLGDSSIAHLCDASQFLAINTQLNAANHGYNVLSRYPRADFACVHEGELRLDARDPAGAVEPLMRRARARLSARSLLVTLGRRGTVQHTEEDEFVRCPALAEQVVERVGAGDAVLALASAAAAAGLRPSLTSFLGNLAAAQVVAVMGNQAAIRKAELVESAHQRLFRPLATPIEACVGS